MSQIPREIIDEIIHRSDIEQVIGSYVTLKRAGSNLNGLCPFHNEIKSQAHLSTLSMPHLLR